eukprot:m.185608 g.185608  ORF g.185608 m.185608 type:complete len:112 (-) comp10519_c0_seq4:11943-12278(-)
MADFAERAGCAEQRTAWGSWSQTGDEVTVLVSVPSGTRGSDLSIEIAPRRLAVALKGTSILQVCVQCSVAVFAQHLPHLHLAPCRASSSPPSSRMSPFGHSRTTAQPFVWR